jgi:hypothetical protein
LHIQQLVDKGIFFCFFKVVPRNLIFAHSAKVTALAKAGDGWDNKSSIVSAAENG